MVEGGFLSHLPDNLGFLVKESDHWSQSTCRICGLKRQMPDSEGQLVEI